LDVSPGRPPPPRLGLDGAEQHTCAELADSQSVRADPSARCARGEERRHGQARVRGAGDPPHRSQSPKTTRRPPTTRGNRKADTATHHPDTKLKLLSIVCAHDHPLKSPLDQRRQKAMHLDVKTTITTIHFCVCLCVFFVHDS